MTPTATPGESSRNTPAPSGIIQTDSMCRIVFNPASGIAGTPTPLSSLENVPTPILNPDAYVIITNPVRTRATETNQRQRQWQLQTQMVSTPRSVVYSLRSVHRFAHSDILFLQQARTWSTKCGTDGRLGVQETWRRLVMQSDTLQKHYLKPHTGR
jgi:hypothetical protein